MNQDDFAKLHKGMHLCINGIKYSIKKIIIPADDIEDRMRHVLETRQHISEPAVIRDFILQDIEGDEYVLKVRDKPTFFWNTKFGFCEEDFIKIERIEVVS